VGVGGRKGGKEARRAPLLLLAVPSHRRSFLMDSMHKRILILCKTLEEKTGDCEEWIPTCGDKGDGRLRFEVAHPSGRRGDNAEGWGTHIGRKVKIPKHLGCATRHDSRIL
jgi:hypothetical protein